MEPRCRRRRPDERIAGKLALGRVGLPRHQRAPRGSVAARSEPLCLIKPFGTTPERRGARGTGMGAPCWFSMALGRGQTLVIARML
jgi:hypothetical protein